MLKPFAEIFPHFAKSPLAVVTYVADGRPACFATEWVGIICETPSHLTFALPLQGVEIGHLRRTRQFAVNLPDDSWLAMPRFRRALQTDGDSEALLSALKLEDGRRIGAPSIRDFPVSLECALSGMRESTGKMYVSGEVLSLRLGENCYGLEGRGDLCRFEPFSQRWLAHSPGEDESGVAQPVF